MNVSLTGSYAVNRGRPQVRVAFTDTGVDQTHPDIQANLDVADSTSFVTDVLLPDGTPIVAEPTIQDFNGHGTWTASAVAARSTASASPASRRTCRSSSSRRRT